MTRINLVPPRMLTDQHLMAEIKEINQLAGQFGKSVKAKNGVTFDSIPPTYRMGKGHVRFFYDKGMFLRKRFLDLRSEASLRNMKVSAEFNDLWRDLPQGWNKDYDWALDYLLVSLGRILDRVAHKPEWYRYYGTKVDYKAYKEFCLSGEKAMLFKKEEAA